MLSEIPQFSFHSFQRHELSQNRFYSRNHQQNKERKNREIPHPGINVENIFPGLKSSHMGITAWKIYLSVMLSLEITSACKIKHTNTQTQKKPLENSQED